MRPLLLALLVLTGCVGGSTRPGVMVRMTELPSDPGKRDAVLDQANATPGPEHRKPLPPKLRKLETTAATAAAILGSMFSKTKNVVFGATGSMDENQLFEDRPPASSPSPTASTRTVHDADYDSGVLVPWVKLKLPAPTEPVPSN